ncbi:helix-turn-helix transcriptional regulator [Daejeonella sp.]|uniref:helix-turn-helix domain-containing protein n=1 Tax=Daejeonella sp. TaxID=2805397 RepID=UPI0030BBFC79
MKRTKFSLMLEAERNRLGHSQVQTAEWVFMTQSAYSRMENGKTNPGVERSLEVIKLLEPHGYKGIQPIELEEIDGVPSISIRWPWHKYWLYALIAVVVLMAIDYMANAPGDLARGFSDGSNGKPAEDSSAAVIFLVLTIGGIVYGLYRLIKKWQQ